MTTALGSPAIGTVRALEVREINGVMAAVRQRIEALERLTTLLQNTAAGPNAANDIQTLKVQLAQLQLVVNSLSSGSTSASPTQTFRASAAVRAGYPVYGSGDGTCAEANPFNRRYMSTHLRFLMISSPKVECQTLDMV
ncbi:MAG TPA: hypothetical protein PLS04_13205, partial [Mycobacterium sp.]|nr:hypothetical protein [Mycobacterium sp.]